MEWVSSRNGDVPTYDYSPEDGQYLRPKRHQKERSIYIIEAV